jgi:hypothetical protein
VPTSVRDRLRRQVTIIFKVYGKIFNLLGQRRLLYRRLQQASEKTQPSGSNLNEKCPGPSPTASMPSAQLAPTPTLPSQRNDMGCDDSARLKINVF